MATKPAARFRVGFVTATVWQNGDFYSVTVTKTFKDGDDYKDTPSLGHGDLLNAVKVLERAEHYIATQ